MIKNDTLPFWVTADLLLNLYISFQYPEALSEFDDDCQLPAWTRLQLLGRIAAEWAALGYHLPWPGLGTVAGEAPRFAFVGKSSPPLAAETP